MNSQAAKKFIQTYEGKGGVFSFVKPSHLEELSPLLECHIEAITVRKDEFHELEGGKTYMPRKETLDKFASAAGVNYNQAAESTRKEGETCYVGRSQGMVMGPDGKMIYGDVCEYEFDAEIRTEEMRLKGKADWNNKDEKGRPGTREYTEREVQSEMIQFRKVGRQRANTGARNRATVAILGMSTGFKGLFQPNEPPTSTRTFLFSRIITNAKNEMVMNAMLQNIGGNTAALFGPSQAPASLAAPAAQDFEAAKPASDTSTTFEEPDLDLGLDSATNDAADKAAAGLNEWMNSPQTPEPVIKAIKSLMDRGENRADVLTKALELVKLFGRTKARNVVTSVAAMIADPKATAENMETMRASVEKALSSTGSAK